MKISSKAVQRRSPVSAGILIDLYLRHQKTSVVIDNYLSRPYLTKEEKEKLEELQIENLTTQITVREIFQKVQPAKWGTLPEHLKQVFKLAASGNDNNAIAVSCNLSTKIAMTAFNASRGESDYIGRKIRKILKSMGASYLTAAVLENAGNRKGCNPGLHFHGVIRIPLSDLLHLKHELEKVFAVGYWEVAGNKAVVTKNIHQTGRWASYCCKSLNKGETGIRKALFSTIAASQAGELLFKQTMQWLRQLPSINESKSMMDDLIRPHIKCKPCPKLNSLIAQHLEQKKAVKRLGRQRTKGYIEQLIFSPKSFRIELIDSLRSAAEAVHNMQHKTSPERANETFIDKFRGGKDPEQKTLGKRYRALSWIENWVSGEK